MFKGCFSYINTPKGDQRGDLYARTEDHRRGSDCTHGGANRAASRREEGSCTRCCRARGSCGSGTKAPAAGAETKEVVEEAKVVPEEPVVDEEETSPKVAPETLEETSPKVAPELVEEEESKETVKSVVAPEPEPGKPTKMKLLLKEKNQLKLKRKLA